MFKQENRIISDFSCFCIYIQFITKFCWLPSELRLASIHLSVSCSKQPSSHTFKTAIVPLLVSHFQSYSLQYIYCTIISPRVILKKQMGCSLPLFKCLQWLLIAFRKRFKFIVMDSKALHDLTAV